MAKIKLLVRHRNVNGDEIMLQRKVLSPWAVVFIVPFVLGFGWRWKDWKLLNQELYDKEEKIIKHLDEVRKLIAECIEIEGRLKREKKDIDESTRETKGYSKPFLFMCDQKEKPFKNQRWGQRPPQTWRGWLNPKAFKGLNTRGERMSVRDKLGIEEPGTFSTRSAYIPEDFKQYKFSLEDSRVDFDQVIPYKEPQQKRNNNNNQNNNNNNNRRNNNRNRNGNDDDYYDDTD